MTWQKIGQFFAGLLLLNLVVFGWPVYIVSVLIAAAGKQIKNKK